EVADARRQEAEKANRAAEETLADLYTNLGLAADERDDAARAILWFAQAARQSRGDPERERANRVRCRTWSRRCCTPVGALQVPATPGEIRFHPSGGDLLVFGVRGGRHVLDLEQEAEWPLLEERSLGAAAWNPDGTWLAAGHANGEVEIVRFPSGERLHRLTHPGPVRALAFSPDGHY